MQPQGIVLLSGAIIIVIRGFLLRPLGLVVARLREENGVETAAPDTDKFCAEIQELVEGVARKPKTLARRLCSDCVDDAPRK